MIRSTLAPLLVALCACGVPTDGDPVPSGLDAGEDPTQLDPGTGQDGAGQPRVAGQVLQPPTEGVGWAQDDPSLPETDVEAPLGDTASWGAPPLCRILQPVHGARFAQGTSIHFEAEVVDPDGDLGLVIWSSDRWGVMVTGSQFDFILPSGDHVVSVEGEDEGGNRCVEDVSITVLQ